MSLYEIAMMDTDGPGGVQRSDHLRCLDASAVHFPHRDVAIVVAPEDVGVVITIEVDNAGEVPVRWQPGE
jgi:hypothetical protein